MAAPLVVERPDLESLIEDVRASAWIAAHLQRTYFNDVSREKPGRHILDVEAKACEIATWAVYQAERHAERLADAYFGAEVARS